MIIAYMFQLGYEFLFGPANWDALQSRGHVYDDNILFRKPDRKEKAIFFFKTILLCNVSFHVLRNISGQLNYPP